LRVYCLIAGPVTGAGQIGYAEAASPPPGLAPGPRIVDPAGCRSC